MICTRCKKEFDDIIPTKNALNYGSNIFACPHCGKAYSYFRIVRILPLNCIDKESDDWGKPIISNKEYNKKTKR